MWDEYVTRLGSDYMVKLNVLFLFLVSASIAGALNRFLVGDVILGFLFAGTTGALVSVLTRLPTFSVYGKLAPALLSLFSRIGTGLAATAVGVGLIASGIFTIALPQGANAGSGGSTVSITQLIEVCGRGEHEPPPADASRRTAPIVCTTGNLFTLLAIGILLGFSERALPSLEQKIFPSRRPTTKGNGG